MLQLWPFLSNVYINTKIIVTLQLHDYSLQCYLIYIWYASQIVFFLLCIPVMHPLFTCIIDCTRNPMHQETKYLRPYAQNNLSLMANVMQAETVNNAQCIRKLLWIIQPQMWVNVGDAVKAHGQLFCGPIKRPWGQCTWIFLYVMIWGDGFEAFVYKY